MAPAVLMALATQRLVEHLLLFGSASLVNSEEGAIHQLRIFVTRRHGFRPGGVTNIAAPKDGNKARRCH